MDKTAIIVAALANVPTVVTVLIGILLNNSRLGDMGSRLGDMNSRMSSLEGRMGLMENRLANIDHKLDTRFDMLLGKVVEIDNRLTRMEAQRH
jgi:hypothetical protein